MDVTALRQLVFVTADFMSPLAGATRCPGSRDTSFLDVCARASLEEVGIRLGGAASLSPPTEDRTEGRKEPRRPLALLGLSLSDQTGAYASDPSNTPDPQPQQMRATCSRHARTSGRVRG